MDVPVLFICSCICCNAFPEIFICLHLDRTTWIWLMIILYFLWTTIFILFPRVYFYIFYFQKFSTSLSHVFISLALLSKWSIDISKSNKYFIKADELFICKKSVIISPTKRCWMSLFSTFTSIQCRQCRHGKHKPTTESRLVGPKIMSISILKFFIKELVQTWKLFCIARVLW